MGQKTGIEWTESTWNPIRGCSRVSEGCRNCYAETVANRFKGPGEPYEGLIAKGGQWNGKVMVVDHKLDEPCRWSKPRMIFVNSMSDLFHPAVSFETIAGIFGIMAAASWHTFQVLTKRPERMVEFFQWIEQHPERKNFDSKRLQNTYSGAAWQPFLLAQAAADLLPDQGSGLKVELKGQWPLPNLWLGVSIEDQKTADERIPLLLGTSAAIRWISAEPLLGPVTLQGLAPGETMEQDEYRQFLVSEGPKENPYRDNSGCIDWVVVGGESGTSARPMHPDWPRSLRAECEAAGVSFLFKQWGEWGQATGHFGNMINPSHGVKSNGSFFKLVSAGQALCGAAPMAKVGKKSAGRMLDGRTWDEYPEPAQ